MKRLSLHLVLLTFLSCILIYNDVLAQSDTCSIVIKSPSRNGINVGRSMKIEGTASIPEGCHLWVFSKREDYQNVWWIQNEGRINVNDQGWQVTVTFGESRDIGYNFDIMVIAVTQTDHILLMDKYNDMLTKGIYTPTVAPTSVCAPVYLSVTKISHQ